MGSAIEKLYLGNVGLNAIPQSEKDDKKMRRLAEADKALTQGLKRVPELLRAFADYKDAYGDLICAETSDFYKEGFRFGFLLALDVLGERKTDNGE